MGDNGKKKMETTIMSCMGGGQNYGPFLGTLNIRCRIIIGTQKVTIFLTTTQATFLGEVLGFGIPTNQLFP